MKKILTKKGFTLIELIVVIGILAVLAAILIPSIINYISEAEDAAGLANARSAYSAAALVLATEEPANAAGLKASVVADVPGLDSDDLTICGEFPALTGVNYDGHVFPEGVTCAAPTP
jgi:type IV pilus assembly protein PilA